MLSARIFIVCLLGPTLSSAAEFCYDDDAGIVCHSYLNNDKLKGVHLVLQRDIVKPKPIYNFY